MFSTETHAIYRLNLQTQEISKISGSDGMGGPRVSRDGRYLISDRGRNKRMLYDFQAQQWSEFTDEGDYWTSSWSLDSKFVYMQRKNRDGLREVVRISVPGGKIERVLDLSNIRLGGYWPGWVSLLPDNSPLLMRDKSTQEIYRLELQYR
jgi:hypothetical protein